MAAKLLFVAVCLLCAGSSIAYPSGAPKSVCKSLKPSHGGASAQTDPSPYALTLNATSVKSVKSEESKSDDAAAVVHGVQVVLESPEGTEFAGYVVQARSGDALVGSFSGDGKVLDCSGAKATVTHRNRSSKDRVSFVWVPPADFEGEVVFVATVVKRATKFWMDIKSEPLTVSLA